MRKFLFIFFVLGIIVLLIPTFYYRKDVVTNTKNLLNIKPQQYYGMTVDMSQILPESKRYIKNNKGQDIIDQMASLGVNTLRITNITSINNTPTPSYTRTQWEEVLGKMKKYNMYAVILVEANATDPKFNRVTLDDYYLNFVNNYIVDPKVCDMQNVLAIDIANEPLLNDANLAKLKEAANSVKSACPEAKITIGSWRTDSGQKNPDGSIIYNWHDPKEVKQLENIVDIDSVHVYGFDKPSGGPYPDAYKLTTDYLNEIRKYTDKPIFIEEFGAGNGDGKTDQNTVGGPELQKNAYAGVLKAMYDFRNKGVLGATGYLYLPRMAGPDSWSIAKDNGNTLLPAAFVFKNFH